VTVKGFGTRTYGSARTLRFRARHRPRRVRLTIRSAVPADSMHRIWVTTNA
jgi:hypothetical protein